MSEQTHKLTKFGIWATIIAALIGAAATLYTHYDTKDLKVEQQANEEQKDKKETAALTIKKVQLTPVDFDIPSSFYVEIENGGTLEANDLTVLIDFGESKIEKCSVKPNDQSNLQQNGDAYIYKLGIKELLKNESIYINCHTSLPVFKKILITGGNVGYDKELTYASYKSQLEQEPTSGWYTFFSILAGIFCVYIFLVIIRGINSILGLSW